MLKKHVFKMLIMKKKKKKCIWYHVSNNIFSKVKNTIEHLTWVCVFKKKKKCVWCVFKKKKVRLMCCHLSTSAKDALNHEYLKERGDPSIKGLRNIFFAVCTGYFYKLKLTLLVQFYLTAIFVNCNTTIFLINNGSNEGRGRNSTYVMLMYSSENYVLIDET